MAWADMTKARKQVLSAVHRNMFIQMITGWNQAHLMVNNTMFGTTVAKILMTCSRQRHCGRCTGLGGLATALAMGNTPSWRVMKHAHLCHHGNET